MCFSAARYAAAALLLTLAGGAAEGASRPNAVDAISRFQYETALAASQRAIGAAVSDHRFTNAAGRALSLGELRGRPLVLALVFTSCHAVCPLTVRHLAQVVEKAEDALGPDRFSVAVLGFDARFDSPQAMRRFGEQQGLDENRWHLLSADEETIQRFTGELGFEFFASPSGFDHIVQTTIIDAEGRIYRQVYGETFDTPLLVDPLIDLVLGRPKPGQSVLDDLIDKVRFFCTAYDPATDAYSFDYSLFIGMVIGSVIIVAAAGFIVREYRYGKRRSAS